MALECYGGAHSPRMKCVQLLLFNRMIFSAMTLLILNKIAIQSNDLHTMHVNPRSYRLFHYCRLCSSCIKVSLLLIPMLWYAIILICN